MGIIEDFVSDLTPGKIVVIVLILIGAAILFAVVDHYVTLGFDWIKENFTPK